MAEIVQPTADGEQSTPASGEEEHRALVAAVDSLPAQRATVQLPATARTRSGCRTSRSQRVGLAVCTLVVGAIALMSFDIIPSGLTWKLDPRAKDNDRTSQGEAEGLSRRSGSVLASVLHCQLGTLPRLRPETPSPSTRSLTDVLWPVPPVTLGNLSTGAVRPAHLVVFNLAAEMPPKCAASVITASGACSTAMLLAPLQRAAARACAQLGGAIVAFAATPPLGNATQLKEALQVWVIAGSNATSAAAAPGSSLDLENLSANSTFTDAGDKGLVNYAIDLAGGVVGRVDRAVHAVMAASLAGTRSSWSASRARRMASADAEALIHEATRVWTRATGHPTRAIPPPAEYKHALVFGEALRVLQREDMGWRWWAHECLELLQQSGVGMDTQIPVPSMGEREDFVMAATGSDSFPGIVRARAWAAGLTGTQQFGAAINESVVIEACQHAGQGHQDDWGTTMQIGASDVTGKSAVVSLTAFIRAASGCRTVIAQSGQQRHDAPSSDPSDRQAELGGSGSGGHIVVSGASLWGALRGLQAAMQLVDAVQAGSSDSDGGVRGGYVVSHAGRWWRGLLIDTARHFMPVSTLTAHLQAMAQSGLNVFHWHIVDSQSFPLNIGTVSSMLAAKGAWSSAANPARQPTDSQRAPTDVTEPTRPDPALDEFGAPVQPDSWSYSAGEAAAIVALAADGGIRVVPEIDTPAHCAAWAGAAPGAVVMCPAARQASDKSFVGALDFAALDPSAGNGEYAVQLAARVLAEAAEIFPDAYMHLGGDEVQEHCWAEQAELREWAKRTMGGASYSAAAAQLSFTLSLLNASGMGAALPGALRPGAAAVLSGAVAGQDGLPALPALSSRGAGMLRERCALLWQDALDTAHNGARVIGRGLPVGQGGIGAVMPWKFWSGLDRRGGNAAVDGGHGVIWASGWYLNEIGGWCGINEKSAEQSAGSAIAEADDGKAMWGAEAAMWSEEMDRGNAECAVWPRAAVAGQRMATSLQPLVISQTQQHGDGPPASVERWSFESWRTAPRLARHTSRLGRWGLVEAASVNPSGCDGVPNGGSGVSDSGGSVRALWEDGQGGGPGRGHVLLHPEAGQGRCSKIEQLTQRAPRWRSSHSRWNGAPGQDKRLRIMSWNIDNGGRGSGTPDTVHDWIRQQAADVVVVIEAVGWSRRRQTSTASASAIGADEDVQTSGHHARSLLGKPTAAAIKKCGFARAAVLATNSDYRIAVMAAAGIRVLWSDGGESFERGVLAVEVAGTVIVAAHLNAHSAAARHREAQTVANLLPALRRLAVRLAGAGERLSKWGCAAVGMVSGDADADANACADRVPVVMAGDLNTLSPLDSKCHEDEGLERWIEQGTLPGGRHVEVPARLRTKYLRNDMQIQYAIDYRPMQALLTSPQGPPPPLQLGGDQTVRDPAWWSNATWLNSDNGRTMSFADVDSATVFSPFDDDSSFSDAVAACSQGQLRHDDEFGELGPMVDLFVAGWSSGQRWSVREEGDDELPSGYGNRCQGTQPTGISMLGQVPAQEIPPFRLDYMLAGPPSVCQGAHSACRILNSTTTMGLSDHFPIMCALSL